MALDSVNGIKTASVSAKQTSKVIFDDTSLIQKIRACPQVKCSDPYVLQKILNRYNFNASNPYPTPSVYNSKLQYGAQERQILSFRRAGIASPTQCHVEIIEGVDTYKDLLYDAEPESRRTFLQQYKFDINGDNCDFTIAPLTPDNIKKGAMDIKGDPYGIESDATVVNPKGQTIIKPSGGSDVIPFSYTSPTVNCMDPTILDKGKEIYEKCDVSSATALPRSVVHNKMISVLQWFNPAPNICEYKMNIQHTYFDLDYGSYYTVPPSDPPPAAYAPPTFTSSDEPSFIVAKWAPDTDYDVESGIVRLNEPIVSEYFYPDLDLRADGRFYRTNKATDTTPLNLPYLSGAGLSGNGPNAVDYSRQMPRFKSIRHNFTSWPTPSSSSCVCNPDMADWNQPVCR